MIVYEHIGRGAESGEQVLKRFIVLTFLVLAWGYWEMSGGSSFVPVERAPLFAAVDPGDPGPEFGGFEIATRAANTTLASLTEVGDASDDVGSVAVETLAEVLAAAPEAPPIPEPELVAAPVAEAPGPGWRSIDGDNVNVRSGPGRDFSVIDQLTRGALAEVLTEDPSGWMEVRIATTGRTGWILGDFLAPVDG